MFSGRLRPATACGEKNFAPWWRGLEAIGSEVQSDPGPRFSQRGVAASDQVTAQPAVSCRTAVQPAVRLGATTPDARGSRVIVRERRGLREGLVSRQH